MVELYALGVTILDILQKNAAIPVPSTTQHSAEAIKMAMSAKPTVTNTNAVVVLPVIVKTEKSCTGTYASYRINAFKLYSLSWQCVWILLSRSLSVVWKKLYHRRNRISRIVFDSLLCLNSFQWFILRYSHLKMKIVFKVVGFRIKVAVILVCFFS